MGETKIATVTDLGNKILIGVSFDLNDAERRLLLSLANADGFATISEMLEWHLEDATAGEVAESVSVWLAETELESALHIMWDATRADFFPWGTDPCPSSVRTPEDFRARLKEWGSPTAPGENGAGGVTEEESRWLVEMGEAALALDGKRARQLGDQLSKAWGYEE